MKEKLLVLGLDGASPYIINQYLGKLPTFRRLDYIGEWHSHRGGVSPSKFDNLAIKEQAEEMSKAGLPGLMMIIGDNDQYNVILRDYEK